MPKQQYKKSFWLVIGLFIIIFLVGGGGLIAYLVRYSATNKIVCATCHPEIVKLWKNSNGHPAKEASCSDCHSPGRKITPDNWNILKHARDQIAPPEYLADDSLTSQRCLDCHEDILDHGYISKKQVIKFTHRFHTSEGLICVDCHRSAGHAYQDNGSNRPSVSECVSCHLKEFSGPPKSAKCLNCHQVILAPGKTWK